jgi:hypothetical protein
MRALLVGSWLPLDVQEPAGANLHSTTLPACTVLPVCCRWLGVRLEGMGALCTLLAALVTVEQQSGRAATMGLLLTYALQVCVLLCVAGFVLSAMLVVVHAIFTRCCVLCQL